MADVDTFSVAVWQQPSPKFRRSSVPSDRVSELYVQQNILLIDIADKEDGKIFLLQSTPWPANRRLLVPSQQLTFWPAPLLSLIGADEASPRCVSQTCRPKMKGGPEMNGLRV